jgi:hypothetical protein
MIYATNKEWLSTLRCPEEGTVYIMSEDGVFSATCFIGSLNDENGQAVLVPDGLVELQRKYCVGDE